MARRFIATKTARLYQAAGSNSYQLILIFGDEVETTGLPQQNRVPVTFRGRDGFIAASALTTDPSLEIYFIDVGQGDSAFVVTPGRKKILIDGGVNRQALGFLTWKYRLDLAVPNLVIDLMVVSHADSDHLAGLVPIVAHPKIDVRRVVHSGIATFATGAFDTPLGDRAVVAGEPYLRTRHDGIADLDGLALSDGFALWRDAIAGEAGIQYGAADASTGTVDVGDPAVELEVLGPRLVPDPEGPGQVYPWFDDPAHTINGHSLVVRLTHGAVRVLFSGDVNIEGGRHLLGDPAIAERLDAHVLKAPHHGSHEFDRNFLDAVRPQIAVISSGDQPDHGHPRAVFVGAVGKATRSNEPLVFSTEIAADFVEAGEAPTPGDAAELGAVNLDAAGAPAETRRVFKKRLHGMINVRTDGESLYAARRVSASYKWESYGPLQPLPRWQA